MTIRDRQVVTLWLLFSLFTVTSLACLVPTGLGEGPGEVSWENDLAIPPEGNPWIFPFYSQTLRGEAYETPMQARFVLRNHVSVVNAATAFEETAIEVFGRKQWTDTWRRCRGDLDDEAWMRHRLTTLAWTMATLVVKWWGHPDEIDVAMAFGEKFNIDIHICEKEGFTCDDLSTPWGLANAIVEDVNAIFENDGWNEKGDLNAEYNGLRYSDWRKSPYVPRNKKYSWHPLTESNGFGFLYKQEHVTPHIGFTAKSFFVGDQKICERDIGTPKIRYRKEMRKVLERVKKLTPRQKAEVEFFDSKFDSLLPLHNQFSSRSGQRNTDYKHLMGLLAMEAAIYEAVIQVWRQKVKSDLIRPTTIIHREYRGQRVKSYLGPKEMTSGSIFGEDWQPYIRVMPHAEFPSGSSCICRAGMNALINYYGVDDFKDLIGGPLKLTKKAGQSSVEKGMPKEDIELSWTSFSKIADRCGETRLEGGMHFTPAIKAGDDQCGPIGDDVFNYVASIMAGEVPEYRVDLSAGPTESRACDP